MSLCANRAEGSFQPAQQSLIMEGSWRGCTSQLRDSRNPLLSLLSGSSVENWEFEIVRSRSLERSLEGKAATGLTYSEVSFLLPFHDYQWHFLEHVLLNTSQEEDPERKIIQITPFWRFIFHISILNVLKSPVTKVLNCVETGCPELIVRGTLFFIL